MLLPEVGKECELSKPCGPEEAPHRLGRFRLRSWCGERGCYFSGTVPLELFLGAFQGQVVTRFTEDESDRKGRSLTV